MAHNLWVYELCTPFFFRSKGMTRGYTLEVAPMTCGENVAHGPFFPTAVPAWQGWSPDRTIIMLAE